MSRCLPFLATFMNCIISSVDHVYALWLSCVMQIQMTIFIYGLDVFVISSMEGMASLANVI
jgi:hypothetical protein